MDTVKYHINSIWEGVLKLLKFFFIFLFIYFLSAVLIGADGSATFLTISISTFITLVSYWFESLKEEINHIDSEQGKFNFIFLLLMIFIFSNLLARGVAEYKGIPYQITLSSGFYEDNEDYFIDRQLYGK